MGSMCKGSGMIHINMGTMLSFVTTDCAISSKMLDKALHESILGTYNCVSVDGDTSTNDTLTIMANGLAGNKEITEEDLSAVEENWTALCENYGGEEAAITALEESHCSKEMYKYIVETNVLTEKCFAHMYGLDGSKVSDEDCADKTAEDGYYMTKHILILTSKTVISMCSPPLQKDGV